LVYCVKKNLATLPPTQTFEIDNEKGSPEAMDCPPSSQQDKRIPPNALDNSLAPSPGLPDGSFSDQKSRSAYILEGLEMKGISVFYGHLVFFTDIRNIL
jgi:hypothetical protein